MIILLAFLFIIGVGLAVYGLSVSGSAPSKPKKKNVPNENKFIQQPKAGNEIKQDGTISLKIELDDLRLKYAQVEGELEQLKKKDSEYVQELARREEWAQKAQVLASKAKEESLELEKKFIVKEKDLEVEFGKNVDLSRQLREITAKVSVLEKANSGLSSQVQSQKMQIEKFLKDNAESVKQIQAHVDIINEMKKKTEQSEWISKIDFNKLNDEYGQLEKELEKKEEQVKQLIAELSSLKSGNNIQEIKPALDSIVENEVKQVNSTQDSDIKKEEGNV